MDAIVEHDLPLVDARRRDPLRFRRFLEAYAQVGAQTASLASIRSRTLGPDGAEGVHWSTADDYLDLAARLMVVEEIAAWNTHLRSRARLTQAPKRCFVDPSLMVALLGADADRLRSDLRTFGFVFESMVARDLRVYAQALDAEVFHYRERSGDLEVDLVVERRDGSWVGVEVKLGQHRVDEAATALRALADRRVVRPPAALVVVTGSGYAYRRPDGVDVVPLTTLRP
ncbi:ATP-binding protein [Cellulomonas soli]|uniref:ATP-binding protein n=1 Tax=Cellulomonas soli TaxID=931535 RepID=UPI003F85E94C